LALSFVSDFIVATMGLKPSPSGETFRFFTFRIDWGGMENYQTSSHSQELDDDGDNFQVTK
jgi:hypothetical protein